MTIDFPQTTKETPELRKLVTERLFILKVSIADVEGCMKDTKAYKPQAGRQRKLVFVESKCWSDRQAGIEAASSTASWTESSVSGDLGKGSTPCIFHGHWGLTSSLIQTRWSSGWAVLCHPSCKLSLNRYYFASAPSCSAY